MTSILNSIQSAQYQINGTLNSTVYGVPLVTCGLIGITSMVLAYVTISENNDGSTNTIIPSNPTETMVPMQGGMHSKKSKRKTHKQKSKK